ncbi:hypothetical protein [Streptomyces spiralis]|uniref:hypothetical protein n=1 Tax=Streptomyces spiralis TaxID=66376 RepID=UPI0036784CBD
MSETVPFCTAEEHGHRREGSVPAVSADQVTGWNGVATTGYPSRGACQAPPDDPARAMPVLPEEQ